MEKVQKSSRKLRKGIVVSSKMQNTVVVAVENTHRHPQYGKIVTRRVKCYAHYEGEKIPEGETVSIMETRPLSKLKRWRVVAEPK